MKRVEWFLIILLITAGLICLTMSASWMNPGSFQSYFKTLVQICMWTGIPLILTGVLYMIYKKRDRK